MKYWQLQYNSQILRLHSKSWLVYYPTFCKEIENDSINDNYKRKNVSLIDSKHFEPIINGMIDVIDIGTATNSKIRDIKIAEKLELLKILLELMEKENN